MNNSIRTTLAICLLIPALLGIAVNLRSEAPIARTYVGQQTCMASGCHAGAYGDGSSYAGAAAFKQTFHQKIHLRPTPETVVIDRLFAKDTTISTVISQVAAAGKDTLSIELSKGTAPTDYFIQMRFSGGGDTTEKMRVAYTYGGNGWIQRYLLKIDGAYYIAPFQYKLPAYAERSDTTNAFYYLDLVKWLTFDSTTGEMRFYKTNSNTFRAQSWDKNCSACHVNGFDIGVRVTNAGADTAYNAIWSGVLEGDSAMTDQNISIGCESCHGPGSEHVAAPTASNIISPKQWPTTREGTDMKLELCNQCHYRVKSTPSATYNYPYDEVNRQPFVPGNPLKNYFRALYSDMNRWPDSSSYAHHQTGQDYLRSKPYQQHVFKDGCWSCHTVHTQGTNGLPYQLKKDYYSLVDGVGCMECHGSTAKSVSDSLEDLSVTETRADGKVYNLHTQHLQSVSQCVNCHFTKTASIGFIDLPRHRLYEFSSHHFKVIRPIATRTYRNAGFIGMMNSCAESCHRNGRGSRNTDPSTPQAPAFGTDDVNYGVWGNAADITLADSLWYHYRRMYAKYLGAVREGEQATATSGLVSIVPTPVVTETQIRFNVGHAADVALELYDTKGSLVRVLASGHHVAGAYRQAWDGTDELNRSVPNGAYIVRLRVGNSSSERTIIVAR